MPWASASTWISMCRAVGDEPLDQQRVVAEGATGLAAGAGDRVGQVLGAVHQPHALAAAAGGRLEQHREAERRRPRRRASSSVRPGPSLPGTTGTPAAATVALARILSPIASIAAAGGPMKTSPASAQARAKAAFSDRNP